MRDFGIGVGCLLEGLQLIRRPRLRRFVLLPLACNLAIFGGLAYWGATEFHHLMDWLLGYLPGWLSWLQYLLWPLFALSLLLVFFYGFSLVANLIAAPFNGLLAEAVERHLTGQPPPPSSWKRLLAELLPTMLAELRKLLYFVGWSLPFLLLFLVPGLNLAAPVLWGLFSAWMLALEYMDYPMANHGLLFPAQRQRLRARRLLALGLGSAILLLTLVPVINFVAMPAGVAGATVLWVRRFRDTAAGQKSAPTG